jgi:3D-(3,5/4)-trihydroxycyclohexane-1,2-dione acylhydrolase (decyclizing)
MAAARAAPATQVIVVDTTPERTTEDGGCWWEVAIPEVSERTEVAQARVRYDDARARQRR